MVSPGVTPMGRQSRSKRERRGKGLDAYALTRIATPGGTSSGAYGRVPIVVPRGDVADHMQFDRAVCAAGLKKFLRPVTPSDQPDPARALRGGETPPPQFLGSHVLVEELSPGLRTRVPV